MIGGGRMGGGRMAAPRELLRPFLFAAVAYLMLAALLGSLLPPTIATRRQFSRIALRWRRSR